MELPRLSPGSCPGSPGASSCVLRSGVAVKALKGKRVIHSEKSFMLKHDDGVVYRDCCKISFKVNTIIKAVVHLFPNTGLIERRRKFTSRALRCVNSSRRHAAILKAGAWAHGAKQHAYLINSLISIF
jgi:hypothetical protein